MTRPALAVLALAAGPAVAGKYNKTLSVGDAAPSWTDLDGTDGKKHALADLKNKDVVVVLFTCNSCPVAADYEDRIVAFATKHAATVAVVAINANTIPADRLDKMTAKAAKKKFPFAYLYDPTQATARAFGATFTPEFFVLDKARKVVYMGAMDDKSPPAEPTANHLDAAVTAVLAGKPVPAAETSAAAGCRIRYNAKRDE